MSSENLRRSGRDLGSPASDGSSVRAQRVYVENVDQAREDQVLRLLLEAFPAVSLESLAGAYAKADGDPNLAAEILSVQTSKNRDIHTSKPSAEKCQSPPESDRKYEDGMFWKILPKVVHSDDFCSKETETNEVKNSHGDFAGASVWRDSSNASTHSGPPDSSSGLLVKSNLPEDRIDAGYPATEKKKGIRSKLSAAAPVYEYQGAGISTARVNVPFSAAGSSSQKISAITGSVSSQMQRRTSDTSAIGTGAGVTLDSEVEVDYGLYSGKLRKKKKKGGSGNTGEELVPELAALERQRDNEDFVHSMFGGEFGIDVVRDVLDHFSGDTDKALDTLLNMGSTASGVHRSNDAEKIMDPLVVSLLGYQEGRTMDSGKPVAHLTADYVPNHEAHDAIGRLLKQEDEFNKDLLLMLCEAFPTVERSSLAAILEAADFSYGGAVDILQDSGVNPVSEKMLRPKLDPEEILQALFRSDSGPREEAASSSSDHMVTAEPWNVVAAKPRGERSPVVQAVAERLKFSANGEWNEYSRQRSSANEHWETMKKYMKEAAAAYNQGDRVRAGVLSEKGAKFKELAQEASNRASQNIFALHNKDIENNITIDLHAQHVKESLQLLKLHLRSLWQIPSVHTLCVITGQGSHSVGGRAKIKPALTKYLEKKRYPFTELNAGCILINMSQLREMDSNQSSESSSDNE